MSELTKCTAALIWAMAMHCDITTNGPNHRAAHNVWDIVDIAKGLDQVADMSDPAAEIAAKDARIEEQREEIVQLRNVRNGAQLSESILKGEVARKNARIAELESALAASKEREGEAVGAIESIVYLIETTSTDAFKMHLVMTDKISALRSILTRLKERQVNEVNNNKENEA